MIVPNPIRTHQTAMVGNELAKLSFGHPYLLLRVPDMPESLMLSIVALIPVPSTPPLVDALTVHADLDAQLMESAIDRLH